MRWPDKFRPKDEDGYIFPNNSPLKKILHRPDPANLILWGAPGTGKTSFARLYGSYHDAEYGGADYFEFTASNLATVVELRRNLQPVLEAGCGWGDEFRVVHIEECDNLSPKSAIALKPIMENNPRLAFILTTNNLSSIDVALQSRCDIIHCELNDLDITAYVAKLLDKEGIGYDMVELTAFIEDGDGDMRRILKDLELRYV